MPTLPYSKGHSSPVVACNPDGLPHDLRTYPQWVVWKNIPAPDPDDKPRKVLFSPKTGKAARTHDTPDKAYADKASDTWATYEDAVRAFNRGGWSGIGFVFTESDPFCGGDIDDCRNPETGELTEDALRVLALVNTYTEVSQSGQGIKFICKAVKPGPASKRGDVEMYDRARYFALTGCHLDGTPTAIEARQSKITTLYTQWFPERATPSTPHTDHAPYAGPLPDSDLLRLAFAAKNGTDVERLYRGDWTSYESQSDADLALCSHLAFYAGPDGHAQVDSLFRASGLLRDKWDEQRGVDTYGQRTLDKAFCKSEWYSPGRKPMPEETAYLITQETDNGCPLMAPVIARVRMMETLLQQRGVITSVGGIEFPPGIDREDLEASGAILRDGFDSLTTVSNYLWGKWYAALPSGKGHHGVKKKILNDLYRDWGAARDLKVMNEQKRLSEFASVVSKVTVAWDFTRPWNYWEKLSRLDETKQVEYATRGAYKGMVADMERDANPETFAPPASVSNTVPKNDDITVDMNPALAAAFAVIATRADKAGMSKEEYLTHLLAHDPMVNETSEVPQCSGIQEKVQSSTPIDDYIANNAIDLQAENLQIRQLEPENCPDPVDVAVLPPGLRPYAPVLAALDADLLPHTRITLPDKCDVTNLHNYVRELRRQYTSGDPERRWYVHKELANCQQWYQAHSSTLMQAA